MELQQGKLGNENLKKNSKKNLKPKDSVKLPNGTLISFISVPGTSGSRNESSEGISGPKKG